MTYRNENKTRRETNSICGAKCELLRNRGATCRSAQNGLRGWQVCDWRAKVDYSSDCWLLASWLLFSLAPSQSKAHQDSTRRTPATRKSESNRFRKFRQQSSALSLQSLGARCSDCIWPCSWVAGKLQAAAQSSRRATLADQVADVGVEVNQHTATARTRSADSKVKWKTKDAS